MSIEKEKTEKNPLRRIWNYATYGGDLNPFLILLVGFIVFIISAFLFKFVMESNMETIKHLARVAAIISAVFGAAMVLGIIAVAAIRKVVDDR